MAAQFCTQRLYGISQLVQFYGTFTCAFCVLNLAFSLVATFGNLLVIRALWKASSMPANLKKLLLNLAFTNLAVGVFLQPMFAVIIAVMLKTAANANYDFDFFCPTILNVGYFAFFFLVAASLLNITAIAIDRILAIFLHLRYQELVSSKRVVIALVCSWFISGVAASILISLHNHNNVVTVTILFIGLLLTTVAYIFIYRAVRYHQNQIHSQLQLQNAQEKEYIREKKSAYKMLFVYIVFVACYFPHLCTVVLLIMNSSRMSFLVAEHVTLFLVLLNSSLNPLVCCWRYREIREIMKCTVKKIFHI